MRYVLTKPEEVRGRFHTVNGVAGGKPNYNIRPGMKVPFVSRNARGENQLQIGLFGFMPPWARASQRDCFPFARSEKIQEKVTFRDAIAATRCLVIADGFYVWDEKQPYVVRLKNRQLFGIAGVFSLNRNFKPALTSFAILTTFPNMLVAEVHRRMPVIIRPEDEARYLDVATPIKDVLDLLLPYNEDEMIMYPVSPRLNSAMHSSSDFIRLFDTRISSHSSGDEQITEQLTLLD